MRPYEEYAGREQTYVKHLFLREYLQTLAFHVGHSQPEIVYVDCFSGPWRAGSEDLRDTSICIALDRLNYVRDGLAARGRYIKVRAMFLEKNKEAFDQLAVAVKRYRGAVDVVTVKGEFVESIPDVLRAVGRSFAFFFIDPTGWTEFAMERIRPILSHRPGEVMVNFMYDHINRFLNWRDEGAETSFDRLFGTPRWRSIRESPDRETRSVKIYAEMLRSVGMYRYATSVRVLKPMHDRTYFHLVCATRHAKGIVELRKVERKVYSQQAEMRAEIKRQYRVEKTGQFDLNFPSASLNPADFDQEKLANLNRARDRVFELLEEGPISFEDLQPDVMQIPLVWANDLNRILMSNRKDGRIVIEGLQGKQRTPRPGCTLRLA